VAPIKRPLGTGFGAITGSHVSSTTLLDHSTTNIKTEPWAELGADEAQIFLIPFTCNAECDHLRPPLNGWEPFDLRKRQEKGRLQGL
jgi:hypothetical protein